MKQILILVTLLLAVAGAYGQRTYYDVFDPNRDRVGEAMKKSNEKSQLVMACQLINLTPKDSLRCLEDVFVYDNNGRITDQHRFYFETRSTYKYDAKNRVINYTEKSTKTDKVTVQLSITYNKKGKIIALTNGDPEEDAPFVIFYKDEERAIITDSLTFADEIFFKNGSIQKVINRNMKGEVTFWEQYSYNNSNQRSKEESEAMFELLLYTVETNHTYDSIGRISQSVTTAFQKSRPNDVTTSKKLYYYTDINHPFQFTPLERDVTAIVYMLDDKRRTESITYYVNDYLLMKSHYYYR